MTHNACAVENIQRVLETNQQLDNYTKVAKYPERKLIILTCMDRGINLEQKLDLMPGEAHILPNAGSLAIRLLLLSIHPLGTNQVMVINHTDCRIKHLNDRLFRKQLYR